MIELVKHALDSIAQGRHTVLLAVVDHHGSVPGTTGAMAVISEAGLAGTIGGGLVEQELCDTAMTFDDAPTIVRFDHTDPGVDSICMGIQDIAMLRLGENDKATLEAVVGTLEKDHHGSLELSPKGLVFAAGKRAEMRFERGEDDWVFTRTLGRIDTLYQIGGGHVALALSRIMATLGFRLVVLDDRPELPTLEANRWAAEKIRVEYDDIARHIPEGPNTWVTIMTQGHRKDKEVLAQLLDKDLRYIGMMGSANKVREVYASLRIEGIASDRLHHVHAPIGLAIGSHTPEEIAISVAAEIVKIRNQH